MATIDQIEQAGGATMNDKRCGNCAHSMESDDEKQVFCIARPPVPVVMNGQILSAFPMLFRYARCDEFQEGKTQPMGKGD